jgi:putative membrane protein
LQDRGEKLLNNPTKDVYIYAKEIIDRYKTSQFTDIANEAIELEDELENMLPNEVIDRLNEKLLSKLDLLAQKEIKKYATQTAISTAISPVAIIDAFLILSRAHVMVHKIASIYGYRPNLLGEILLFKKVFALLAFASVTDILANHSHDLLGTSLLSKLSAHSAQGVANGVLIARIGIGVIKACRPLKSKKRLDGFLESIITSISSSLFKRDK